MYKAYDPLCPQTLTQGKTLPKKLNEQERIEKTSVRATEKNRRAIGVVCVVKTSSKSVCIYASFAKT